MRIISDNKNYIENVKEMSDKNLRKYSLDLEETIRREYSGTIYLVINIVIKQMVLCHLSLPSGLCMCFCFVSLCIMCFSIRIAIV